MTLRSKKKKKKKERKKEKEKEKIFLKLNIRNEAITILLMFFSKIVHGLTCLQIERANPREGSSYRESVVFIL